jgi:hypothetical protein
VSELSPQGEIYEAMFEDAPLAHHERATEAASLDGPAKAVDAPP